MNKENFNPTNLNDLLIHLSVVNVTDPVPDEAAAFLQESYRNNVFVTGTQLTQEMMNAIITRKMEDFRHKYCEAPFLIIHLDKDDACKTALQHELVFFLNVRQYKNLSTILLSKDRLTDYPLTNDSLIGYARAYDSIRK